MVGKLSIRQRIQVGFVLATAFLLVLASNLLDRKYFSTIQETVKSIYDDRIVVQDYIYQLQDMAHEKEIAFIKGENLEENKDIKVLLNDFSKTKLTRDEARLLKQLDHQFSGLEPLELAISTKTVSQAEKVKALDQLDRIHKTLDGLEKIQLEQGGVLTQLSEKNLRVNKMLSNLEIAFLTIIGVSILILVFYPVKVLETIR
ncbi:hypothetical protein F8C76_00960 [Flagellimonas olearia]|uniref:Chemotaxis methyl-accepting receptor HlyB-like 4HB MCP domain-containing protein n=1 Tax=Flagellimonas olearia TaxID=552546 RepID=A0A6I1DZ57_9FLAO|nr:hypothetical protein [Allomuricauda olearia]KAB7530117.1 hypothetical protein F8C76_00960 [Allomuricauda olearia]